MTINCARQPVIILGMHRSGTTLVAELLRRVGLLLGRDRQVDGESTWFLAANDRMLRQVNAAWDNPEPFLHFLDHPEAVRLTLRALRTDFLSAGLRKHLGLRRYLKSRSLQNFDQAWGWKEPRTVFTLPLWLELFPAARIIHIVRHGVDVAASLKAREEKMLAMRQATFDRRMRRVSRKPALVRAGYRGSARCLSLSGGFSLWEQYVAQAEHVLRSIDNPRIEIRYEDLLADPLPRLRELAGFCAIDPAEPELHAVLDMVNPDRARAFESDPVLLRFFAEVQHTRWMAHYGYGVTSREPQQEGSAVTSAP